VLIPRAVLRTILRSDHRIKLYGDLVAAILIAVVVVASVWFAKNYVAQARYSLTELHMNDFGKFYYSARSFLDGGDLYAPNVATTAGLTEAQARLANMNPPHFHLVLLPLALLPPVAALIVWQSAGVLALIACFVLIGRELSIAWTGTQVVWVALATLLCSATGMVVITGQITFLLMVPMTLAWIAARRTHWTTAAAWLGLAVSVKPFLAVFGLYLVLSRRWRAAMVFAAVLLVCTAIGVLVFHWSAYRTWLDALSSVHWVWLPMNGSIDGLVTRAFAETPEFTPIVVAPAVVRPLVAIALLVMGTATVIALVRDESPSRTDRAFALLLLFALLASPLGWAYYAWLLAGPLAGLVVTSAGRPSRRRDLLWVFAIPGLLWPVALTVFASNHRWAGITFGSVYTWMFVTLWLGTLTDWRVREDRAVTA